MSKAIKAELFLDDAAIDFASESYAPSVFLRSNGPRGDDEILVAGIGLSRPYFFPVVTDVVEDIGDLVTSTYYEAHQREITIARLAEDQMFATPQPIVVMPFEDSMSARVNAATMAWLAEPRNSGWANTMKYAVSEFRRTLMLWPDFNGGEYGEEGAAVGIDAVTGVPEDRQLFVPSIVVNAPGSVCIASAANERDWRYVSFSGSVEMRCHNACTFMDTIPMLAGFAAVNSLILKDAINEAAT